MVPELQEMFMQPMPTHQTAKCRAASPEKPPSKKPCIEESVVEDDSKISLTWTRGHCGPSNITGTQGILCPDQTLPELTMKGSKELVLGL